MVLKDGNIGISRVEDVVLIGSSGFGKPPLLRSLNIMEGPTRGRVIFEGTNLVDKAVNLDLH